MKGFLINSVRSFLVRVPSLHRLLRYRDPRAYWRKRGGEGYYQEQEVVDERHARSKYIAERLGKLSYASVLEIGCGYGKQLRNLKKDKGCFVVGIDWSRPQLVKAKEICAEMKPSLLEADATKLPFRDKSFDLVLTSAVILHNREPQAKEIVREILRVAKKYVAHNEDTDLTWTRFGYDMRKTYEQLGQKILESGNIPLNPPMTNTQFTVVELNPSGALPATSQDVPLQYYAQK